VKPRRAILHEASTVTAPSSFLLQKIQTLVNDNSQKYVVIPNWIEPKKFVPMQKEKYILLVSRLFVNKGIQDFLFAIKDIDLKWRKVKIVGDWPYRETLLELTHKYNLVETVEFLWWIDNTSTQMKELYGKATIFCQPSHFENASIVLLEAMQAWSSIIARNIWWNPEVISLNQLFEDIKSLQEKIFNFLNDEKLLETISNKNIEKIKSFEWVEIVGEYEKSLNFIGDKFER
jgi:glycosyltransferase involved in cell wall biosynthesis